MSITSLVTILVLSTLGGNVLADATDQLTSPLIPHGEKALAGGSGIREAWYSCETDRYRHGVLGDSIEGGCLVVTDSNGETHRLTLADHHVFEDNTPRIADMDGDGRNDVITIRSDVNSGAGVAIYTLNNGTVVELASSPTIGLRNRWLAPAGIADFNDDGVLDIAWVQTPHIGGILRVWSMIDGEFSELDRLSGFSNHSIGSTRVSTSRVLDANDDGVPDLALPDQSGSEIVFVTLSPATKILRRKPFEASFFDTN